VPRRSGSHNAVAVSPWSEVAVCYTDDSDGNGLDQVLLGVGAADNDGAGYGPAPTDAVVRRPGQSPSLLAGAPTAGGA
jgi:hypothetical protein